MPPLLFQSKGDFNMASKSKKNDSVTHLGFRIRVTTYIEAVLNQTLNYSLETNPEAQTVSEECPLGQWESW